MDVRRRLQQLGMVALLTVAILVMLATVALACRRHTVSGVASVVTMLSSPGVTVAATVGLTGAAIAKRLRR